ncbi:hypothetical protein D3C87_189690 [compost metagenome]
MTKKILTALGAILAFSAAPSAEAARGGGGGSGGVMLTANAFMYNQKIDNNGTEAEANTSIYDIKLGYLGGSGLYLGAIYSLKNTDDGTNKKDGSAYGGSIGYIGSRGFFIQGHYLASAKFDRYSDGSGYQADFGYMTSVSSSVLLGVELSYRSIEYKKDDNTSATISRKETELTPKLTIGFAF